MIKVREVIVMDKEWTNTRGYKEPYTIEEINRGRDNARRAARAVIAKSPILQEVVASRAAASAEPTREVSSSPRGNSRSGISLYNDLGMLGL